MKNMDDFPTFDDPVDLDCRSKECGGSGVGRAVDGS